jgi:hypothetical protein
MIPFVKRTKIQKLNLGGFKKEKRNQCILPSYSPISINKTINNKPLIIIKKALD